MDILKAFKYRLKLSPEQTQQCVKFAGANRFAWNYFLGRNKHRLEQKKPICWYQENDFYSKLLKRSDEYSFLKTPPAHTIQQTLKDLDRAFSDCFDKKQPLKRLPRFKRKGGKDSFRFPEPKHFELEDNRIKLPKLGWCKFFNSRVIIGDIRNITVSKQGNHWFVSTMTAQNVNAPRHPSATAIGIDVGIKNFIALSSGQLTTAISPLAKYKGKLAKLQRRLAKKKKFSNNWRKQKEKIGKLHTKIANTRKDFQHKISSELSKNHAMIAIEDLQVNNMSRSAKGDLDNPGKNIRQKAGLNRGILDQGWSELRRQLEYKQAWSGGIVVAVSPHHTSQICSCCGYQDKANRQTQATFKCVSCGFEYHADSNAANNILARGHRVLSCGETALADSVKQEPEKPQGDLTLGCMAA
jgi:IS605 OrfB family transposase